MRNKNNEWEGEGNLVRDPEIHTLSSGGMVVHFSIAISGAGESGTEKNAPGYFDCKMWLNENDYVAAADVRTAKEGFQNQWRKGTRLHIWGALRQERWEKDGSVRSKVLVMAERVEAAFFEKRNDSAPAGNTTTGETAAPAAETPRPAATNVPVSF